MSAEFSGPTEESDSEHRRIEHHLEKALARSDDREATYHIREALHLLYT
ncbi:hypothetical protein [Natrononativus amylolyticus]|nr:hypothetical protein [Natrononativus amylolyticus]